jgi:hypothetical protein
VRLKKPGSAVLDQAGPSPSAHRLFVEALEYLAVDPGAHQHVRGEQTRWSGSDDSYWSHGCQSATGIFDDPLR